MILVNSWNFSPKHFPFPAFPILLNITPILPLAQVNIVTVTINLSFILNISKSNTLASLIILTLKIYPRYGYAHHVHYHNSGLCHCHCLPDYCNSVSVVYLILLLSLCVFLLARETLSKWIFRSHLNTSGASHLTSSTSWSLHSDLQDPTYSSTLSFSVLSLASLFSTSPFPQGPWSTGFPAVPQLYQPGLGLWFRLLSVPRMHVPQTSAGLAPWHLSVFGQMFFFIHPLRFLSPLPWLAILHSLFNF